MTWKDIKATVPVKNFKKFLAKNVTFVLSNHSLIIQIILDSKRLTHSFIVKLFMNIEWHFKKSLKKTKFKDIDQFN